MIHKPSTQLEADLAAKDSLVINAAEAAHHLAVTLRNVHASFWALPTERLLAVLNADISATLATFQANTALGTAVNAILDQLADPRFPTRAPVEPGRADILFDGTQFVHLPEPEPAPEPSPEPEA